MLSLDILFADTMVSSLVRVAAASVHIAAEESNPDDVTLRTIYITLEGVGLAPLLGATIGFLGTVSVVLLQRRWHPPDNLHFSSQNGLDKVPLVSRGTRVLGLLSIIALALTVAGGAIVGSAKTEDRVDTGNNLRHIGIILFAVQYVLIVVMHGYFWGHKEQIMRHRRTVCIP